MNPITTREAKRKGRDAVLRELRDHASRLATKRATETERASKRIEATRSDTPDRLAAQLDLLEAQAGWDAAIAIKSSCSHEMGKRPV